MANPLFAKKAASNVLDEAAGAKTVYGAV